MWVSILGIIIMIWERYQYLGPFRIGIHRLRAQGADPQGLHADVAELFWALRTFQTIDVTTRLLLP